jgi:hypothetical protein
MIKRLESLKNNVNKYMADIRPHRLTTCQSERKSVVSRRPSVAPITYMFYVNVPHKDVIGKVKKCISPSAAFNSNVPHCTND